MEFESGVSFRIGGKITVDDSRMNERRNEYDSIAQQNMIEEIA